MTRRHHLVLVPTDFSQGARSALDRALRLPLAPGAKVVLLHVLPADLPGGLQAAAETNAQAALAALVAAVTPPGGIQITGETAIGVPFEQIIARARSLEAGLIVIGRHGRRPVRDMFIGSTADRTIRYGDVPVLVVNLPVAGPYQRPLVATDLGDTARRVADLAVSVLEPDVEIDLVHAFRIPFAGLQNLPASSSFEHELAGTARTRMEDLVGTLGADGARWRPLICRGDARATIITEIVTRDSDLVVLGTHGRSGIARVVVGSVAEYVISAARCDVLVTRPARFTFEMPTRARGG